MALIDSAVDGLLGAIITGSIGYVAIRKGRPKKAAYDDAWKQQAEELGDLIREDYASRVAYLERQCDLRDRTIRGKDTEISRLQRLLGQAQGRGGSDD